MKRPGSLPKRSCDRGHLQDTPLTARLDQMLLHEAIEMMADGVAVFNNFGRLVFFNRKYLEFFSMTADVRVIGAHWEDIFRASFDRGEELTSFENHEEFLGSIRKIQPKAGNREIKLSSGIWLEGRMEPTKDDWNLIVYSEITKSKKLEAELRRVNKLLENQANTDFLTGLANRRHFDRALSEECANRVQETPISLALIDVDRFKNYNDSYGHQAGDTCLTALSALLITLCDATNKLAARYGGEELALILPLENLANARIIAESFRQAVFRHNIEHTQSEYSRVTVSIGVACTEQVGRDPQDLIKAADLALYRAKMSGRNLVSMHKENKGSFALYSAI